MERLDGSAAIPPEFRGGIVALGNFDGFHKGHQAVVGRAVVLGRAHNVPALAATFDPHPVHFFRPDAPPFRLTSLAQRARLFAEAGADGVIVFPFDKQLAMLEAGQFVAERLKGIGGVVTGSDFTFGRGKTGSVATLAALGRDMGFFAEAISPISDDGAIVSSSRIRQALQAGNCELAAELLTRPFAIEGTVIHGAKLGREIGFPTANLALGDYLRPRYGIYAVRVQLDDGRVVPGAANLGIRPSFDPPVELLEVHLFDFSESLYDRTIAVELISFLRPEARFDSLDALTDQMAKDCAQARDILR